MTVSPLIEIEGLRVVFHRDDGRTTRAVDSIDLAWPMAQRWVWSANPAAARA